MSEHQQQEHRQRVQRSTQSAALPQISTQDQVSSQQRDQAFDALLDQIDSVLETNAEDYVRGFVQKGGQ